ncbi:MAG: BrnT family toxin [Planctomycetes bacterium]|nr:BrnT family toxin [Planctomycetota bacterium]
MVYEFEWDSRKSKSNLLKHKVSFEEAASVFDNPLAEVFRDKPHSNDELRDIIVGHSRFGNLLVVSFLEKEEVIRIISARAATKNEQKKYEEKDG